MLRHEHPPKKPIPLPWCQNHPQSTSQNTWWQLIHKAGKLRGKQPKLSDKQQKELRRMHDTGDYSITDLVELFSISRRPFTAPSSGNGPPQSHDRDPARHHRTRCPRFVMGSLRTRFQKRRGFR